jgi:hypothetical protein
MEVAPYSLRSWFFIKSDSLQNVGVGQISQKGQKSQKGHKLTVDRKEVKSVWKVVGGRPIKGGS